MMRDDPSPSCPIMPETGGPRNITVFNMLNAESHCSMFCTMSGRCGTAKFHRHCTDALSALDDDYAGLRCFARQVIAEKSDDSDDLGSEVNR
jgi:hypothetical protein